MKNVKLLFTVFAVIAIVGGVLAAKHKNSATYYSCDPNLKCTVTHNISNINELQTLQDGTHGNIINNATVTLNADCPSSNCGTLYYGTAE